MDLPVPFGFLTKAMLEFKPAWNALVENFRARTRALLARVEAPELAVHSAACYHHCNTESVGFSEGYEVGGVSLAKVVDEFTTATLAPTRDPIAEVEGCSGFACGADCCDSAAAVPQSSP